MEIKKCWYKEMTVYQIWPRSFKDGKDIARVMDELGGVFRDLMINKSAPAEKSLLSAMPHQIARDRKSTRLNSSHAT